MHQLNLAEHVRFCVIDGQYIFLDLKEDRYFGLPRPTDAAFAALLAGDASSTHVGGLQAAGLLVKSPAGRPLKPTTHPAAASSFLEDGELGRGISTVIVAEVLLQVLGARRAVRKKRLPGLLAKPGQGASESHGVSRERRDRAVGQFLRARRAIPIAPNCLYDSLALRRFLQRRSVAADLVIGTKLHPFAAHCWLQDGTMVLNDSLSAARGFAPVLVA
jgi:hypothetical protein